MADTGYLPADLTSLVGRGKEVRRVRSLLGKARLVTVTGPGGMGKTRVALRVARDCERVFPDGVWLVELAALRDPALVESTVAAALGEGDGRLPRGELARGLRDRQVLLVLDNCEHVLAACAELVGEVLRLAPDVRVLATSREMLHVTGEHVVALPPLPVPEDVPGQPARALLGCDSVQLLVDRARAADDGFELTPENAGDVARLCRGLDGVPLAIELAAGRLHTMSLRQIAERLDDPYRVLTGAPRDVPGRHSSLQDTITWSYQLCSPAEQRLWARMSVFAGPADAAAVQRVCGTPDLLADEIPELLDGLVRKSVITLERGEPPRFRMLDTIRHHGRLSLDPERDADLDARHSDHHEKLALQAATSWFGPAQLDHAERLRRILPDLRVAMDRLLRNAPERALRLAQGLFTLWICQSRTREGGVWLDRALAAAPPGTPERADALWVQGWTQLIGGEIETARATLRLGVRAAEQLGRPAARDYSTMLLGVADGFQGAFDDAVRQCRTALDRRRAAGDDATAGVILVLLAEMYWARGDLDNALSTAADSVAIGAELGEQWIRSYALWVRSMALSDLGDTAGAAEAARRCLEMKLALGDTAGILLACEVLSWTLAAEGCWSDAALLHAAIQPRWADLCSPLLGFRDLVAHRNACHDRLREHLGATRHRRIEQAARAMTVEEASRLALRTPDPDAADDAGRVALVRDPLTPRETEVAALVAQGLGNRDIAGRLVVSPRTAEVHVERILVKLGFSRRAQIAAWWRDTG